MATDFVVELTYTTGQHQAITRSVTILDCDRIELAKVLGIEELLQWANEEDSPIPNTALTYWQQSKSNGNVQVYEALSELENKYNLTFTVQPAANVVSQEVQSRPAAARKHKGESSRPVPSSPFNLEAMLAEQLTSLQERQKELALERERINVEFAANAKDISKIRRFFMLSVPRRNGRREESAQVA